MESSSPSETIISSEVEIVGTLKTTGSVQFNGKLEGDLHCEGTTTIGKSATIKGNLIVESVSLEGAITGNITAKDRIQMLASAQVNGDIKAKRLTVEDGVTFIGRSEVNPSGQPPAGSTPSSLGSSFSPGAKIPPKNTESGK